MVNGKTLYSRLTPDDVADYVVLCGDPWRAEKLAKRLDTAEHKGFFREFNTYTGTYKVKTSLIMINPLQKSGL